MSLVCNVTATTTTPVTCEIESNTTHVGFTMQAYEHVHENYKKKRKNTDMHTRPVLVESEPLLTEDSTCTLTLFDNSL
jgi:hypothetical protein